MSFSKAMYITVCAQCFISWLITYNTAISLSQNKCIQCGYCGTCGAEKVDYEYEYRRLAKVLQVLWFDQFGKLRNLIFLRSWIDGSSDVSVVLFYCFLWTLLLNLFFYVVLSKVLSVWFYKISYIFVISWLQENLSFVTGHMTVRCVRSGSVKVTIISYYFYPMHDFGNGKQMWKFWKNFLCQGFCQNLKIKINWIIV